MREFGGIATVLGWFFLLCHRALAYGFNPDDVMLINFAIDRPLRLNLESIPFFWNGYIRPLGTLFYLILYRIFGYWAQPYRVAAFAVIVLNLILLYWLGKVLTGSKAAALLVALMGCFHSEMWDIYANTGTVYDLLCQTFVLTASGLWAASRDDSPASLIAIGLLTVGAVEAKEMGVALPAVLLLYDLLFRRQGFNLRHLRLRTIAASGAVTAVFLLGRFAQQTALTGNPAFTPVVTLPHYLFTTRFYLNLLLFEPGLTERAALLVLCAAVALSLALRSRLMLFGIGYYLLLLLPLSFAPARGGYALYVPGVGALLFAVGLFLQLTRWAVASFKRPWLRPALAGAVAATVMSAQVTGAKRLEKSHAGPGYLPQMEALTNGMRRAFPRLPTGAEVTLVNDEFQDPGAFIPLFTLRAFYNDPLLSVKEVRWDPARGDEQLHGAPYVLFFSGLRSWRFGSLDETGHAVDGRPRESVPMWSPTAGLNLISGFASEAAPDGTRWTLADARMVFSRPQGKTEFTMDYDVPGAITDRTGPLHLHFEIEGLPRQDITIPAPGAVHYAARLPPDSAGLLHVRIVTDNPFLAPDGAKLAFLARSAAVQSIE